MRPSIAGHSNQIRILNRFLIEKLAVRAHSQSGLQALCSGPKVPLGDSFKMPGRLNRRGDRKARHATIGHVRR
jgi:hypothetical protein